MAVLITVVIMLAAGVGGWYYFNQNQTSEKADLNKQISDLQGEVASLQKKVDTESSSTTNSNSQTGSSQSNNSSDTVDPYLYTNSTYGFSLQFNSKWQGYKIMPADVSGATKTYYVCLPTTEANWQKATSTSLAATASVFAFSVYTKSQWTAATSEEGPVPTKVGEAGSWIVAYSTAQDFPQDGNFPAAIKDYKNVIATFKAL